MFSTCLFSCNNPLFQNFIFAAIFDFLSRYVHLNHPVLVVGVVEVLASRVVDVVDGFSEVEDVILSLVVDVAIVVDVLDVGSRVLVVNKVVDVSVVEVEAGPVQGVTTIRPDLKRS